MVKVLSVILASDRDCGCLHTRHRRCFKYRSPRGKEPPVKFYITANTLGSLRLEAKRPLGRPRRRWEGNIKMYLQEVGGGRGDWMELAQDRDRWRSLVGTGRDFRVP